MKLKKMAFTLIELLVVISIIALLIGILLPALGAARKTANKAKNQTQVRGIVQNATVYAASNTDKLPNQGTTAATGTAPNSAGSVFSELTAGDLSPELLINPVDIGGMKLSTDVTITYTNSTSAEFSYAWVDLRSAYYKNDTNTLTPLIADRATDGTGANVIGEQRSVWNLSATASDTSWEGSIGWADGHGSHLTSGNIVGTGSGQINTSWADGTARELHDSATAESGTNALMFN